MFVEAMATPQVESRILWPGDQLALGWVVTPGFSWLLLLLWQIRSSCTPSVLLFSMLSIDLVFQCCNYVHSVNELIIVQVE
jgi:hypothetical protein